ncbi:hypothetical protein L249_3566 [Ophiocordyceps polyrhachis-furcata BCC 54312]|uniref:Uncharacterized protein n=1 Tax=Ophiocordyceps polyrhachis-furcata BCC 54312 TaxID=1330021 RepID=A0A367LLZ8_9HYPO|nr:hypothetical protein L249_3566 [Ophiocordyceps polyrhachis-furcata BCC 54312]
MYLLAMSFLAPNGFSRGAGSERFVAGAAVTAGKRTRRREGLIFNQKRLEREFDEILIFMTVKTGERQLGGRELGCQGQENRTERAEKVKAAVIFISKSPVRRGPEDEYPIFLFLHLPEVAALETRESETIGYWRYKKVLDREMLSNDVGGWQTDAW